LKACGYIALPGGWTVNAPVFSAGRLPSELRQRISLPRGFAINRYAEVAGALRAVHAAGDRWSVRHARGRCSWSSAMPTATASVAVCASCSTASTSRTASPIAMAGLVAETTAVLRVRFDPAQDR
jgi:hypothetical protein